MNKLPVLLTTCIVPDDSDVLLKAPEQRLFHTLESVGKWLAYQDLVQLVICDGSGYDFSEVLAQQFPGADIELLAFKNNKDMVLRHGKGYGEGEIIKYALQHSRRIAAAGQFAKCTGKLWVDNFRDCIREWRGPFLGKAHFEQVFSLRPTTLAYMDTRFYVSQVAFYQRYFADAHVGIGGPHGISIEDSFKNIVVEQGLQHILFATPPVICGVGGGSGSYYKNNLKRRIKDRIRARLVMANPQHRSLFAVAD